MKTCPECGTQLSDKQEICPACGVNYLEATIASITGNAGTTESDTAMMLLNGMEDSLRILNSVAKPTLGDTLRRMALLVWGVSVVACVVAGLLCKAPFFYILAIAPAVPFIKALVLVLLRRQNMTNGERVAMATAKVFAEDAEKMRAEYAGSVQIIDRIDAMQDKVDNTLASLKSAHKRNKVIIIVLFSIVLAIFSVGVGALAIHNFKNRKAEAEYAALPEWIKARDNYLSSDQNNEYGDNSLRMGVITLMLEANEEAAAESFFFDSCMGYVGDADCALLIINHYRKASNKDALNIFIDRLTLRYNSDTAKLRKLKL